MSLCPTCNSKWNREAEYFRDYLLIDALAECKHPELVEVKSRYERACMDRERRGMKRSIFQTDIGLTTRAIAPGLPTSPKAYRLHDVNLYRIYDVIARTFRSIVLRKALVALNGAPLTEKISFPADGYILILRQIFASDPMHGRTLEILRDHGSAEYGDGLLKWCGYELEDRNQKELLLSFYDTAVFHGQVAKAEDKRPYSQLLGRSEPVADPSGEKPVRHVLKHEPIRLAHAVRAALQRRPGK